MADETYEEDRKLFVGGLSHEVSQDDLREYFEDVVYIEIGKDDFKEHFSQFGAIAEVIRPIDNKI